MMRKILLIICVLISLQDFAQSRVPINVDADTLITTPNWYYKSGGTHAFLNVAYQNAQFIVRFIHGDMANSGDTDLFNYNNLGWKNLYNSDGSYCTGGTIHDSAIFILNPYGKGFKILQFGGGVGDTSILATQYYVTESINSGLTNTWSLTGNSRTDPTVNYIGTNDAQPLIFKQGGNFAGVLDGRNSNTSFGIGSLLNYTATSIKNTVFGVNSLTNIINGFNNTSIGLNNGTTVDSGYNLTFVGDFIEAPSGLYHSSVGIGNYDTIFSSHEFSVSDSIDHLHMKLNGGNSWGVLTNDGSGNATWQKVPKVDSLKRKSGSDSVFYYINGIKSFGYRDTSLNEGTVASIGLTSTSASMFSFTGSPITTNGTIGIAFGTENANTILAGATSGGVAVPSFRALVAADIPNAETDSLATPTTGQSCTNITEYKTLIVKPAGTLVALTVIFPIGLVEGQRFNICISQIITTLTLTPAAGQTIDGTIVTSAVNSSGGWIYNVANTTWFKSSN